MKIMFNCLTMEKGGAERVITALANAFSADNDVVVLSLTRSKDAYKLDSSVKRLCVDSTSYKNDGRVKRKFRKLSLKRLTGLKRIIKAEKPDIIISFLPEPSIRLMFLKKISKTLRGIPTIISIRTDPKMEYKKPLIRAIVQKLYRNVDGMVYQTDEAKKFFDGIITTKNQVVIHNPVDESNLVEPKPDSKKQDVIIAVGRLEKPKNQELLIRAFKDIPEEDRNGYVVKIYGDGSNRGYLEELIGGLQLKDKVFLMGQIDDVAEKLNESKMYVFTSLYEGMPNSLIEAMAMGLPCIATDCPCGGPRALIKNGENGILIRNNSKEELVNAIRIMIRNDSMRKKLANKALETRKTNSIEVISRSWMDIMNKVLKKESKGGCRVSA